MRVALLQIASPDDESPQTRLARVSKMVLGQRDLARADLLVLPEIWRAGYFSFDSYTERAEPFDGPSLAAARAWAREYRCAVHLGSFVEDDGEGGLHNTSVVVDAEGEIAATYRKVHLFGYGSQESQLLVPGARLGVGTLGDLKVGITTCYDLRFPELFRSLVDVGAEAFLVCAAWPAARLEHWRLFTTTRAIEQQSYMIAVNAAGAQGGVELGGASRVVDPWGAVLAEAGADEGFTYADLDPHLPQSIRNEFPALADRRWPLTEAPDADDPEGDR